MALRWRWGGHTNLAKKAIGRGPHPGLSGMVITAGTNRDNVGQLRANGPSFASGGAYYDTIKLLGWNEEVLHTKNKSYQHFNLKKIKWNCF